MVSDESVFMVEELSATAMVTAKSGENVINSMRGVILKSITKNSVL